MEVTIFFKSYFCIYYCILLLLVIPVLSVSFGLFVENFAALQ